MPCSRVMNASLQALLLLAAACATSTPSATQARYAGPEIRKIAVVSGDSLGDAVSVELFNQGFKTLEISAEQATALPELGANGIDAVLIVRSEPGYDSLPESATVRLVSTRSQETIAALNWANSRLGARGSPADRMVRKSTAEAAQNIVRDLRVSIRQ